MPQPKLPFDESRSLARLRTLAWRACVATLLLGISAQLGCSSAATDGPPSSGEPAPQSPFLNAADAETLATRFIHAQDGGGPKSIARQHVEIDCETKSPLFFIFTFADRGFVIVSSDRRQGPILGYSVDDPFDLDGFEAGVLPPGLAGFLDEHAQVAHDLRIGKPPLALDPGRGQLTPQRCIGDDPCGPPKPPPPNCHDTNTERVLPTANWAQGCGDSGPGWNADAPVNSGGPCGHAVTGCVATAMGIAMKFHGQAPGFDFSSMSDSTSTWEAARLLRAAGNSVDMDYGASSSSSDVDRVAGALNGFGYNASEMDFSAATARSEIDAGRPVIMRGAHECSLLFVSWSCDGHVWVVDGWRDFNSCDIGFHTYLHTNWGWGSTANGWYAWNGMNGGGHDFNYDQKLVVGIRPR